ncbi:MAG: response regulator [Candidatus Peribacteraceae bacterium]|nr:response regulator [Candidatus Peribacteraceae bacterium]MDD5742242.1 response regulator [Candidatus Peribacteraceae bacterium]
MGLQLAIIKDDDMTEYVVQAAQEAGFVSENIHIAKNQQEAFALIQQMVPDIAVVNQHLTDDGRLDDGIEVIRTLHDRHRRCIIICLTSCGTPALGQQAQRAGARDYVDASLPYVNWYELLREKLVLWQGVVMGRHTRS